MSDVLTGIAEAGDDDHRHRRTVEVEADEQLDETARGEGGFGSTGKA